MKYRLTSSMRKKAASPPAVSGGKVKRRRRLDLIGGASRSMRRRHGFATMYVSHKSVGVGVLDDPAARPRRAELLDVSEPGTSGRGSIPARRDVCRRRHGCATAYVSRKPGQGSSGRCRYDGGSQPIKSRFYLGRHQKCAALSLFLLLLLT